MALRDESLSISAHALEQNVPAVPPGPPKVVLCKPALGRTDGHFGMGTGCDACISEGCTTGRRRQGQANSWSTMTRKVRYLSSTVSAVTALADGSHHESERASDR